MNVFYTIHSKKWTPKAQNYSLHICFHICQVDDHCLVSADINTDRAFMMVMTTMVIMMMAIIMMMVMILMMIMTIGKVSSLLMSRVEGFAAARPSIPDSHLLITSLI